jgi:branched-chain amino acid aminotransferase
MSECVFFQGKYVPEEQATLSIKTHCIHYGTAIFEGIRANWNDAHKQLYVFRLREHYERHLSNCKVLQIKLPYDVKALCDITLELLRKNDYHTDMYIRPLSYKSAGPLGVRLHCLENDFLLFCVPFGAYLGTDKIKCCVSTWRRPDFNVIPPQLKSAGLYINNALAKTEASQNGFDDAIMLTPEGYVSEGSGTNLFMVMRGELITPPTYNNCLKGITRETVMTLARKELGLNTIERPIDRGEIYQADECFMCGTGAHLVPVGEIDHRPVGRGEVGEVTQKLMRLYFEVIKGDRPAYREWCTPVYPK